MTKLNLREIARDIVDGGSCIFGKDTRKEYIKTIEQALEQVREETVGECAEIVGAYHRDQILGDAPPGKDEVSAILSLLPQHKPDCNSQVATLNRFRCNCQKDKEKGQ